jgi:hypothetical protein
LDKKPLRHEKHKSGSHDQQLQKQKRDLKTPALFALGAIIIAGLVASYFLFFSPKAQFKRAFNTAISAFEQKKNVELARCISESYSDEGGNTETSLLTVAAALFDSYDKLYVRIKRMDIKVLEGGKAELTVEGAVYFKTGNETYRFKTDKPVILYMAKESDGRRRLTSIQGMDFKLESVAGDFEDLR